jgi:hypothetical protein
MTITYDELLDHIKRVIKPTLEAKDYLLSLPPATRKSMIWFVKEPRPDDMLLRFVEFQPSGLSPNQITRVAINLARRSYVDFDYPPEGAIRKGDLYVPLTPWLWKEKNADPDSPWWYIHPLDELDARLNDMLEKIIDYGIPFIEDVNSTQTSWLET